MDTLELTPDELLTTTRAVRRRLDLTRPVEPELIRACLEVAVQAPTGSNLQGWHFVVVTDADRREALADCYRRGFQAYRDAITDPERLERLSAIARDPQWQRQSMRVTDSAAYLAERLHEVPVLVVPCMEGRPPAGNQAGFWGSIHPATWSFMLAARARGLGTAWTSLHLLHEREAAEALGIPYEKVSQAALIPVAHYTGDSFRPAKRRPLEEVVHWNGWDRA